MEYLPLFFDVKGKTCLLVGGGTIAYRKAKLLVGAGARLAVVAPAIEPDLLELVKSTSGEYYEKAYGEECLTDKYFVIAATNNENLNEKVAVDCRARNVLVNVVDAPEYCDVIFPAIIDRAPIVIAVSSSGAAPVLARSVRTRIESTIPANFGVLANFIGERRDEVRERLDEQKLRLFWEDLVQSEIAERVMMGRLDDAQAMFARALAHAVKNKEVSEGEVYLIGAGPGDPDLLTFKALRLLQRADVVLYDRLVSSEIVAMSRRDAEHVYVGKMRSEHTVPQQEINRLLIEYASEGKKVARLKGGDPFVFGRGGEEIAGLAKNNIPFQIVPGVSAANGCACYAGIPLTHRDHAQSVMFVTGHLKDGSIDLPWAELVTPSQTVVVYMGLISLPIICEQLVAHGAQGDTPVALIERGTTPDQQTHIGTLTNIVDFVADKNVQAPTLIIVGGVVNLYDSLSWR
ncbi:MAG: siroheme synthase CysG [Pseudomonadales bacterium]|nr:siroheme synthase CysG [Pseudomonadales bacterium]